MKGRLFLEPARDLAGGAGEPYWRSAAGRTYYATFQEARAALERWRIVIPPRENIHTAVRLRFLYAGVSEPRMIGDWLDELVKLRNEADYKLNNSSQFRNIYDAENAIIKAENLVATLDATTEPPERSRVLAHLAWFS